MNRRGLRGRGDRGEDIALAYFQKLGYRMVERNYQTRYGEVDIIVTDGRALVFVEVKLRRGTSYGHPLEAITPAKRKKIITVAEQYLVEKSPEYEEVRFDVVGISGDDITHIEDAFQVT